MKIHNKLEENKLFLEKNQDNSLIHLSAQRINLKSKEN